MSSIQDFISRPKALKFRVVVLYVGEMVLNKVRAMRFIYI